jgi:hypothetical protein
MPKRINAVAVLAKSQRVITDTHGHTLCDYCYGFDGEHSHDCLWYALFQSLEDLKTMRDVLEWYAEKARAMNRYASAKPPKAVPMTAVVTELSLDCGLRAASLPKPEESA